MGGYCEHNNKSLGFIKGGQLLGQLNDTSFSKPLLHGFSYGNSTQFHGTSPGKSRQYKDDEDIFVLATSSKIHTFLLPSFHFVEPRNETHDATCFQLSKKAQRKQPPCITCSSFHTDKTQI
jgi:hypothetical protein